MPRLLAVGQLQREQAAADVRIRCHPRDVEPVLPERDVRQRHVNALRIGGRSPLDAAERAAPPDARAPQHLPFVVGIERVHDR